MTFFSGIGQVIGQGNSETSQVKVLDKYGSQVVFAGDNKVGVFNLANMEVYQLCEPTIGNIIDVAQDMAAAIIYAATNAGVYIFDTKYSSSAPLCKSIALLPNQHEIKKIAVIKNSVLALSEGVITSYNLTHINDDVFYPPTYYQINNFTSQNTIKSLRLPNTGNYLVLAGEQGLECFEVGIIGIGSPELFDFAGLKIFAVVVAVGGFVLWKVLTKKKTQPARDQYRERNNKNTSNLKKKVKFNDTPQTFNYNDSD